MSFKDKINNWYDVSSKEGHSEKLKVDKNYTKHYIKPCSMVSIVGSTGSGKSTALLEFLNRKNSSFYEIILFTGSTVDEPLYNMLKSKIDGIELIDNVDDLPELTDFNDTNKQLEKLAIFDDIINLPKKELLKIQKWFNSARKYGFTCVCMIQNYTDEPIQMRRNTMYWLLFKLNDITTVNNILKKHNTNGDKIENVKKLYFEATREPKNFFMIDLTSNDKLRYRHNFTDFMPINK